MKIRIKNKNKNIKKIILIPEIKIKIDQVKKTKMVWPMSGWAINNKATARVIKKENRYFKLILVYFWLHKIALIQIIKKGLTNSIGWNLGNRYKSIHLLDPLTSIPTKGTKIRKNNANKKIKKENLKSFSWFIDDKPNITIVPKKINIKCLKKNE